MDWDLLTSNDEPVIAVRRFLMSCVNRNRLFALDEAIATIVTLVTVSFSLMALLFEELRWAFGVVAFFSILFFWVGYRIARILHSVEYRLAIIASFFPYITYPVVAFVNAQPLDPGSAILIGFLPLIVTSLVASRVVRIIWIWLSDSLFEEWSPWDIPVPEKSSETQKRLITGIETYWNSFPYVLLGLLAHMLTILLSTSYLLFIPIIIGIIGIIALACVFGIKKLIDMSSRQLRTRLKMRKALELNDGVHS